MSRGDPAASGESREPVTLVNLFFTFVKIGFLTFGGGLAMIGVLRHEIVQREKWLAGDSFLNLVSLSTAVPGAIAVNLAFLVGRRFHGKPGILVAVLGVVCPSFFTILILLVLFTLYLHDPRVSAFFIGASAAVTALIAYSSYLYGKNLFRDPASLLVSAGALLALFLFKLHPVLIIFGSLVVRYLLPDREKGKPL